MTMYMIELEGGARVSVCADNDVALQIKAREVEKQYRHNLRGIYEVKLMVNGHPLHNEDESTAITCDDVSVLSCPRTWCRDCPLRGGSATIREYEEHASMAFHRRVVE